jgi:hypothetical protein
MKRSWQTDRGKDSVVMKRQGPMALYVMYSTRQGDAGWMVEQSSVTYLESELLVHSPCASPSTPQDPDRPKCTVLHTLELHARAHADATSMALQCTTDDGKGNLACHQNSYHPKQHAYVAPART